MDENKINSEIGLKLKELRKEANLTQVQLAEKSWIARSYISDIEKWKAKTSYSKVVVILEVLGYSIDIN